MADNWQAVASGTLGSALDLGTVSGAMRDQTSQNASALQLVMTAPQGWPGWAAGATGGQVIGDTLTWTWQFPWLGTALSSLDASPFSPATAALIQDAVMTSGQINWTLYQQTSTATAGISNPVAKIAAQNVETGIGQANQAIGNGLGLPGNVPWVPIGLVIVGLFILTR